MGAGTLQRMLFRQGYATLFRQAHPTAHAGMGPVSYTHLDVYKRQALMWLLAALFFWPVLRGPTASRGPARMPGVQFSSTPGSHSENAGT